MQIVVEGQEYNLVVPVNDYLIIVWHDIKYKSMSHIQYATQIHVYKGSMEVTEEIAVTLFNSTVIEATVPNLFKVYTHLGGV